ncbi:type IV pilus modification PilV family protein [Shewanella mangrovi]|nr:type II secretion system protein [Shewanella mangrovi]
MKANKGFTLIELIVGMIVFSIAVVLLSSVLLPQSDHAANTLQRVRATELAQSVLNEIWGKGFDDNTPINGVPACGSPAGVACGSNIGPDSGESRNDFDDVDDYDGLNQDSLMLNSTVTYASNYPNYQFLVSVSYIDANHKLIAVVVTTPAGEPIAFNAVRSNY